MGRRSIHNSSLLPLPANCLDPDSRPPLRGSASMRRSAEWTHCHAEYNHGGWGVAAGLQPSSPRLYPGAPLRNAEAWPRSRWQLRPHAAAAAACHLLGRRSPPSAAPWTPRPPRSAEVRTRSLGWTGDLRAPPCFLLGFRARPPPRMQEEARAGGVARTAIGGNSGGAGRGEGRPLAGAAPGGALRPFLPGE